jgi:replication-associated recombination protein RarA
LTSRRDSSLQQIATGHSSSDGGNCNRTYFQIIYFRFISYSILTNI